MWSRSLPLFLQESLQARDAIHDVPKETFRARAGRDVGDDLRGHTVHHPVSAISIATKGAQKAPFSHESINNKETFEIKIMFKEMQNQKAGMKFRIKEKQCFRT